jgi:nuclear pore complex protein Nup205
LAALPFKPPSFPSPSVEVQYSDGSRVATTVESLTSFLRLRSYIFDLVALDLHTLTNRGHFKGVSELLELIYGNEQRQAEAGDWDDVFQPFHAMGQSNLRIIEYVQSLFFDWVDALNVDLVELQLLGQLDLTSCLLLDDKGCEVVDQAAVLSLLSAARHLLHTQGRVVTPVDLEHLNAETAYVLESCAVENRQREVLFAVTTSFESWRRLVDMTLVKCFTRLPRDRREMMLSDLLQELPPIIRSGSVTESTAVLLSEVSLSLITKLREDWRGQQLLGVSSHSGSLSSERLYALLRSFLECVLDYRVELVRGNLYAALVNYFHLATDDPGSALSASKPLTTMTSSHDAGRVVAWWSGSRSTARPVNKHDLHGDISNPQTGCRKTGYHYLARRNRRNGGVEDGCVHAPRLSRRSFTWRQARNHSLNACPTWLPQRLCPGYKRF